MGERLSPGGHDYNMPHRIGMGGGEWGTAGCPPNCPARLPGQGEEVVASIMRVDFRVADVTGLSIALEDGVDGRVWKIKGFPLRQQPNFPEDQYQRAFDLAVRLMRVKADHARASAALEDELWTATEQVLAEHVGPLPAPAGPPDKQAEPKPRFPYVMPDWGDDGD